MRAGGGDTSGGGGVPLRWPNIRAGGGGGGGGVPLALAKYTSEGGGGVPLALAKYTSGGGGGGGRPNDAYMSAACVKKYNFAVNLLCVSSNTFGREIYKFQA